MRKIILSSFITIILLILFSVDYTEAASKSNTHNGAVIIVHPNIIVPTTIAVRVSSYVYNQAASSTTKGIALDVNTSTPKSSYNLCGGSIATVSPGKIGTRNITLYNDPRSYILDAKRSYNHKYSNGYHVFTKGSSYTVKTTGQFYPQPNQCMGGGQTSGSFSFTNN